MPPETLRWADVAPAGAVFHVARRAASDVVARPHSHDFAELFWVESGRVLHRTATGMCRLRDGDIVLVAPSDVHSFSQVSIDFSMINVAFSRAELHHLHGRYFETAPFPWDLGPPRRYRLGARISPRLIPRSELAMSASARMELDRLLLEVMTAVTGPGRPELPPWLAEAVQTWKHEPASMMRGVTGLAEVACRSRGHVSRVVRQATGETATALVNRLRLEEAAARLRLTDAAIAAVAADVGFNSLGHFYRLFRVRYGTSPGRYRDS